MEMLSPCLERNNPRHQYMLKADELSSFAEKELEVQSNSISNVSQQCALAAKVADIILG